jgi:PAS domain S-box-containing protein
MFNQKESGKVGEVSMKKQNSGIAVLYVEDEPHIKEMVLAVLNSNTETIYMADNNQAGWELYQLYRPDIVMIDSRVPVINGLVLAKQVKTANPRNQVIIITNDSQIDYFIEAIDIGVNQYVLKPINHDKLVKAIERCFEAIALERRQQEQTNILKTLYRAVEQTSSMVEISDFNGNLVYINPKFTEVTGYTNEEALGKTFHFLKSGLMSPEMSKQLWDKLSAGGEWRGEYLNRKKNGEMFWESTSISPVKNEAEEFTHYVMVKEDITGRKLMEEALHKANVELENQLKEYAAELDKTKQQLQAQTAGRNPAEAGLAAEQLRQLLSSMPSIIIGINSEDEIFQWNTAAETAFGITAGQIMGRPLAECNIQWNWEQISSQITKRRNQEKPTRLEAIPYHRPDGKEGILDFSLLPFQNTNSQAPIYFLIGTDIINR